MTWIVEIDNMEFQFKEKPVVYYDDGTMRTLIMSEDKTKAYFSGKLKFRVYEDSSVLKYDENSLARKGD